MINYSIVHSQYLDEVAIEIALGDVISNIFVDTHMGLGCCWAKRHLTRTFCLAPYRFLVVGVLDIL